MAQRIASSRPVRAFVASAFVAAGVLGTPRAHAQTVSDADRAQELFDEARELMKAQRFPEACAKLAESQTLDPGGGTLLNLGICRQGEGRTATAFELLTEALAQARAAGRSDRITTAERHLAELAPLLSTLTIALSPNGLPPGTVVELDGAALSPAVMNGPVPLDPGEHELQASCPGYAAFSSKVTLGPNADSVQVTLPALTPLQGEAPLAMPVLPAPPAAAAPAAPSPPPAAVKREAPSPVAYALIAGGGVALAAGTYFGVQAFSKKNESDDHFDGTHCTEQSCVDSWNSGKNFALASDIAFGVGAVAVGAGLYLVLARPKAQAAAASGPHLTLRVNGSGASASGSF
jgi:hypothetical protein